jgi:hypothetical protein
VDRQSEGAAPKKPSQDILGDLRVLTHEPKAGTATKLIGYCGVLTLDFGDELAGLGVALTTAPKVLGYRSPRCNWGLGIQQRIKWSEASHRG